MKNKKNKKDEKINVEENRVIEETEMMSNETTSMTDKEMYSFLVDLHGTNTWKALRRLIDQYMISAENSLCSLDPLKSATEMSRHQGIRIGLYSLYKAIESEKIRREKGEDVAVKEEKSYNGY